MAPPGVVDAGDSAWVLTSAAFVLLMTPGLAFFYGGLVRGQNVLNTMMMSVISMGIVAMTWFSVGFSLSFGSGGGRFIGDFRYAGLLGLEEEVWPNTGLPALLFVTFQMTFAIIGAAIISGAIVERMRFSGFVVFITLWSVLVYTPICHWVWGPGGWIDEIGGKDYAGGTVVHESTSVSALVLAILLGPRTGHKKGGKPPPHNVPFVILGAALLWFGWSGFNAGSALSAGSGAALALVNTYLSASASMCIWTVIERCQHKRFSAVGPVTGAIVGLVVITPAAGFVAPHGAVLMGAIGCALVFPTFHISHDKVDDSLDAFPCHGISGFVGTILTGFFAKDGGLLYGGGFRLLGAQALAAFACALYAAIMSAAIFCSVNLVLTMRVQQDDEVSGLDVTVHGEEAYRERYTPSKDSFREDAARKSFRDLYAREGEADNGEMSITEEEEESGSGA